MAINHNQMPVFMPGGVCDPAAYIRDMRHACMNASTHLKFFADWIFTGREVKSIGDICIDVYEASFFPALYIWIVLMIRDRNLNTF